MRPAGTVCVKVPGAETSEVPEPRWRAVPHHRGLPPQRPACGSPSRTTHSTRGTELAVITRVHEVDRGTGRASVSETLTLIRGDLAVIVAATVKALRESAPPAQEAAIPTPAPSPRRPNDSDDVHSGDNAGYRNRADVLLGSFAKGPVRSYSLSDLVGSHGTSDDGARDRVRNQDRLFSGRPLDGRPTHGTVRIR